MLCVEAATKAVKTEWDLTFDKDPSSFEVSRMVVCTDQLLQIKAAPNARNIYPWEDEADIDRRKKAWVELFKQFHTHYYWLYEKGMTCAMVGLQGLHSADALKCPSISAGIGHKSFCPWCLKLGGNTETIAAHLPEVHY